MQQRVNRIEKTGSENLAHAEVQNARGRAPPSDEIRRILALQAAEKGSPHPRLPDLLSSLHPSAFLLFNTNQPLDATHMF